ncbi:hypothetical protein MNV49_005775 [Pseudohyphozyma bogoriensis]|nr:hypothetical protein MNV49_005775 [Pseudohyphozyma bogoriensis]
MSASACPVSGSTASSCPASSSSALAPALIKPTKRKPTLPQQTEGEPLLYLPPLLSLLPPNSRPSTPSPRHTPTPSSSSTAFSFSAPTISYTTSSLPSIDPASVALHDALHNFKPVSTNYAREEYAEAFNWPDLVLPEDIEREWYIVAFRSIRAPGSPSKDLYQADRDAHEEAVGAGGLICYWYGVPQDGYNLATCIWQSRKHAVAANSGKKHVEAMKLAAEMYAYYGLERYVLRKVKGETGVTVDNWVSGEVSFGPGDDDVAKL